MYVSIRPLTENDLEEANHVFRLAFGTFLGLPDWMAFFGYADYVKGRFHSNPSAGYGVLEVDGSLLVLTLQLTGVALVFLDR